MQLRDASGVLPDHAFTRRVAVLAGLFTAVALAGTVGVLCARSPAKAAPPARDPDQTAHTYNLRYTQIELDRYATIAFPRWAAGHPDGACPQTLLEVNAYLPWLHGVDPWGHPYRFACARGAFSVHAPGADGAYATADDLASRVP